MIHRYLFCIAVLVCFVASCSTAQKTIVSPADLKADPLVTIYKDPGGNFGSYKTFSVFPLSMISKEPKMNEIMERQLLFQLRNLYEMRGYQFVKLNEKPDFLVTIGAASEYRETYIPPNTVTIPWWVPGQTTQSSGTFNFNRFGAYSSYGWGNYSGTSTTSGYFIPAEITTPGRTLGYHYPVVIVKAYDGKTFQSIFEGKGVGISDNPDVRVSGQGVLLIIIKDFPMSSIKKSHSKDVAGIPGVFLPFTIDGNNYYPIVAYSPPNGSMDKGGIKRLDMILSIDGVSLLNKTMPETQKLTFGKPGTDVNLEILRNKEKLNFIVRRQTWAEFLEDYKNK